MTARRSSPAATAEMLAQGRALHQAGRLAEAEALYRRVLSAEPKHPDALHLLGLIAQQAGQLDAAIQLIRKAVHQAPRNPFFHYNLGNALAQGGRHKEAADSFRHALSLKADFTEARKNLAVACNNLATRLQAEGRGDDAIDGFRRAAAADPASPAILCNLAAALQDQDRPDEALAVYRQALALHADYPDAYNGLGAVLQSQGRNGEAGAAYRRALAASPFHATLWYNLGVLARNEGRQDEAAARWRRALVCSPDHGEALRAQWTQLSEQGSPDQAEALCRAALVTHPDNAEALFALGELSSEQGAFSRSVALYRRAVVCGIDGAEAFNGLGIALSHLDLADQAEACYRLAIERERQVPYPLINLAELLATTGSFAEIPGLCRRALAIAPDHPAALTALVNARQQLCDWTGLADDQQRLAEAIRSHAGWIQPFVTLGQSLTAEDQLAAARRWAGQAGRSARPLPERPVAASARLRIGYLSADYRQHPVAVAVADLIERHDRGQFEVIGYSYGTGDDSPIRRRLEAAFDRLVDLRPLSHEAAARQIRADGVDVLVDLTGYTQECRFPILAWRPAPIQVGFLGYAGTMGTSVIDYLLADPFVAPAGHQAFFDERLVHLPGSFFPLDSRQTVAAAAPDRTSQGLPERATVFCCFNAAYKIAPTVFDSWMRLLHAVPDSVLWLSSGDQQVRANLQREAGRRGIAGERLVFASRLPSLEEHLARHRLADLFLDTSPYNAHSTAADALRAGLPVLTCAGQTFASRVAGSLLTALGLPELITGSLEEYGARALELVRSPDQLAGLRQRLADNLPRLLDGERYARGIEAAYLQMRDIALAGKHPEAFAIAQAGDGFAVCTLL